MGKVRTKRRSMRLFPAVVDGHEDGSRRGHSRTRRLRMYVCVGTPPPPLAFFGEIRLGDSSPRGGRYLACCYSVRKYSDGLNINMRTTRSLYFRPAERYIVLGVRYDTG